MKSYINNTRGSLMLYCLIIGMVITMFGISGITLSINEYQNLLSNTDSIRAYYLAEIGSEIAQDRLISATDKIIIEYLDELKNYKIGYILQMEGEMVGIDYMPPSLETYLSNHLIKDIGRFNDVQNNCMSDYPANHSYTINVNYDKIDDIIVIECVGRYNKARRRIITEFKSPYIIENGHDIYMLPKIKINTIDIISYYETIFTH